MPIVRRLICILLRLCFGTHDPNSPNWNNTELSDSRSWTWMTYVVVRLSCPLAMLTVRPVQSCNQFGFFPVGASAGHPTIVSRHLTPEYSEVSYYRPSNISHIDEHSAVQRSCQYDFPGAFKGLRKSSLLNALAVNVAYGGWNVTTDRIIFANGERKFLTLT